MTIRAPASLAASKSISVPAIQRALTRFSMPQE
jgi:hypothetical protein